MAQLSFSRNYDIIIENRTFQRMQPPQSCLRNQAHYSCYEKKAYGYNHNAPDFPESITPTYSVNISYTQVKLHMYREMNIQPWTKGWRKRVFQTKFYDNFLKFNKALGEWALNKIENDHSQSFQIYRGLQNFCQHQIFPFWGLQQALVSLEMFTFPYFIFASYYMSHNIPGSGVYPAHTTLGCRGCISGQRWINHRRRNWDGFDSSIKWWTHSKRPSMVSEGPQKTWVRGKRLWK